MKEWKTPWVEGSKHWPPNLEAHQPTVMPKDGHECEVVRVNIRRLPNSKAESITFNHLEAYDAEGNKYDCVAKSYFPALPQTTLEFPCNVPPGIKLKKFRLEELSFDLEGFEIK
jgi:hypothetical protein